MDSRADQQDRMARRLMLPTLVVGAKSARNSYEMVRGQPVSDGEWMRASAIWERNWQECVELYEAVNKAQQIVDAAYEQYKNS